MSDTPATSDPAAGPDPKQDRDGCLVSEAIADVILLAQVLAAYGRFLVATIPYGILWRGFATVAQFFGTAKVPAMLPRILRGLMRAEALERVLLARARRGGDLKVLKRSQAQSRAGNQPGGLRASRPLLRLHPAEAASAPRGPREPTTAFTVWSSGPLPEAWADWNDVQRRSADELLHGGATEGGATEGGATEAAATAPEPGLAGQPTRVVSMPPLTLADLPSMEQLEEEARRRPVGQTITDICLDLGISPALCAHGFWDRIMWAILDYRGSLAKLTWETLGRKQRFEKDDWKYPRLPLPEQTRDGIRKALGFFIGEPPVDPFRPVPAAYAFAEAPTPPEYAPTCVPADSATGPP